MDTEAIWEIVIKPTGYWLFTIIPAILAVIGEIQTTLPPNQRSRYLMSVYHLLPYWAWLVIAAIAFVLTIVVSANRYVKRRLNQSLSNRITQSIGQTGGITASRSVITINNYEGAKSTTAEDIRRTDQLTLSVEHIPVSIISVGGKDFRACGLVVKNLEKRKIVELQATMNFDHFDYSPDLQHVFDTGYDFNAKLFWSDEKKGATRTQIELRPQTPNILLICELSKLKTENGHSVDAALMTSDPVPIGMSFARESIFQIRITFQGKLEGEYEFRSHDHSEFLYTKPVDQRIAFLEDAERAYPDIPKSLLESGKAVMEYLR